MLIIFNGTSCPIKYFSIGVQGNNLVDKLEFVVDKTTPSGLDLATCTPYIKLQNAREKYFDKDGRVDKFVVGDKLHLLYQLSRKTTQYAAFDVQLQFEKNDNDIDDVVVWQTESVGFTLSRTIPADTAIARQHPAVIQDLTRRVERLETEGTINIKIINGGTP